MKLETYTKIFITSVLISLAFLANATGNVASLEGKPMATISNFPDLDPINDDIGTAKPFDGVDIEPLDIANLITVTISLTTDPGSLNAGTLVGGGFNYSVDNDNYTLTETEENIETALSALVYTPAQNQIAPNNSYDVVFNIKVEEATVVGFDDEDVTVTVNSINDAPVINSIDPVSINEDNEYTVELEDIEFTDVDFNDNTTFTFLLGNGADYTIVNSNIIRPNQDFFGDLFVPVRINDGNSNSQPFNLEITVNPINDAPKINGQDPNPISINEDGTFTVNIGNLDFSDIDANNQTTFTLLLKPGNNYTVENGNIINPNLNYNGNLTVPVTISDGENESDEFNLDVDVIAVNDPPSFTNIPTSLELFEDNTNPNPPAFTFQPEVEDPDNLLTELTFSVSITFDGSTFNETTLPNDFWLEFDTDNGELSGTPKDGDDGFYIITISVSDDGNLTKIQQTPFSLFVEANNSPPSFKVPEEVIEVGANQTGTVQITEISTDANDPNTPSNDPNQSITEVIVESNNQDLIKNENLTTDFDPDNPNKTSLTLSYTTEDEGGIVTISVTIRDNGASPFEETLTFTINILEDNNAPEIPVLTTYTVKEDETNDNARRIIVNGITPGDGENDQIIEDAFVNVLTPNIIQGTPTRTILKINNSDTYRVIINYELVEDAFGTVELDLTVRDNANSNANRSSTARITLDVENVDDAPIITGPNPNNPVTVNEGGNITLSLINLVIDHPDNEGENLILEVLEGDDYELGDGVNEIIVNEGFGSNTLNVNVKVREINNNGTTALEGTGVLPINVSDVNTAPIITGQTSDNPDTPDIEPFVISEDNSFELILGRLIIQDDNSANLSISRILTPAGSRYEVEGNTITPEKDFFGLISVPVFVSDGELESVQPYNVAINVQPVNDNPTITGQFEVIIREEESREINIGNLKITDVDNDDEDFTLTVLAGTNYTFTGNEIIPNANFFGDLFVPVRVNDGSANSNTFEMTVKVLPVNDAPTINDIADRQVPDDNGQTIFVNFSGVEAGPNENGQNLTITAASGNESLIQDVEVIYTPNQSVGLLRMETIPNREGRTTITVTVKDDGGTVNGGVDTKLVTFDVTVLGQNSAPTLDFISDVNLLEDFEPSPVRLRNIRDGDDGSQQITITATSSNPGLIPNPVINYVQGETEATLIYNPVAGQNGSTTITVTVKDDGGTVNGGEDTYIVTFEISILGLNDRPTIDAIPDTSLLEDTDELVIILTGITDGDLDEVQKMAITATSSRPEILPDPTVIYDSVSTTAELILNPMPNISGISTITVTIKDDGGSIVAGQEDTRTITFQATVLPVNDQPTINPITDVIRFLEGDDTQRQLISGITDGDPELIQIITSVTVTTNKPEFYESLEVAYREGDTNGELIFKTDPDANGMDTLTITVTDNGGTENGGINTVSTLVYIDVIPQNDPPTITNLPGIELPKNADPDCIALSGITDGDPELEQNITITAVSNRPDIIPNPIISEFKPNAGTATLCYEPLEDARGVVIITITVTDDGGIVGDNSRSIELEINVGENNNAPEIRDENGEPLEELNLTTSKDEPLAICFQVIDRDQDEVDLGQIISRNTDAGGEILPGSFTFKDDSLCFIYEAFPNTLSGEDWFEFTICDDVPGDIACDTIRLNIEILPSADLRIYDGISPKNSDGKNDAWFIEGIENYPNNVVQIYSTSGELVYEANGYDNRDTLWRGESNTGIVLGSRELPTGVYYYVIDLNGGSLPPQKGSVIIK